MFLVAPSTENVKAFSGPESFGAGFQTRVQGPEEDRDWLTSVLMKHLSKREAKWAVGQDADPPLRHGRHVGLYLSVIASCLLCDRFWAISLHPTLKNSLFPLSHLFPSEAID